MHKEIHLRNGKGYDQYIYLLKRTTDWIAERYEISPDSIRFTCGATGALDAIFSLFDTKSVIATMPFEYFDVRRLAEARGLRIATPKQPRNVYSNSITSFTQWLKETEPEGCYISLPNNPNGQEYTKKHLTDVFMAMAGKIVIIDQSLLAHDAISLSWLIANRAESRLYVVRSFSKSHGLVGDRIGMLSSYDNANTIHKYAHAPSATSLRRLRRAWTSNHANKSLQMINQNNIQLTQWGGRHSNLFVAPSKTNCTCIHFHNLDALDVSENLKKSGIFVNTNVDLGIEGNFIRVDITVDTKSIAVLLSCIDEYITERKR